jgi:uncharacterized membrane-anchored protein YhcB (DUF1043 family)
VLQITFISATGAWLPTFAALMEARQNQDAEIQRQIQTQQADIDSQRREIEQLKAQQER